MLDRRAAGEPLEYIVGWAEFRGLRVPVRSGVFVPRRRSEFLAGCAVGAVRGAASGIGSGRPVRVLDMCCGSGAIGLAVAIDAGGVELVAVDDSPAAVACARDNLAEVDGRVYQGDLFAALPRDEGPFDVIVASPPYVPTSEIGRLPLEARAHEPLSTLDGGLDGASVQRRILEAAREWLRPGGVLLIETAEEMAELTAGIAVAAGFAAEIRRCADLSATVVVATPAG